MIARRAVDELSRDAHTLARLAHAAFEDMTDAELPRDLRTSSDLPLNVNAVLRATTPSAETFDRSVMMSSVIPSLKYSCSGSPLMLANGSTQIDILVPLRPSPLRWAGLDPVVKRRSDLSHRTIH